jgi:hypothetical protein
MSTRITTTTELRSALTKLAVVKATTQLDKLHSAQVCKAIASYAWELTTEERATMHSAVVSQVAREYGLASHTSSKQSGWPFYPQTFSEKTAAGKSANMAVSRATRPLRPTTAAQAKTYIASITAPKVTIVANSRDKAAALAKKFLALTPAMQRLCLEQIKAGRKA